MPTRKMRGDVRRRMSESGAIDRGTGVKGGTCRRILAEMRRRKPRSSGLAPRRRRAADALPVKLDPGPRRCPRRARLRRIHWPASPVNGVHLRRGDHRAVEAGLIEGGAGVGRHDHAVAHVRADAHRRRNAPVGRQAQRDDRRRSQSAQPQVEVGADERGVDALRHQGFARLGGKAVAQRVAGKAGREGRAGLDRIMAHVNDDPAAFTPGFEQTPRPARRGAS